MMLKLHDLIVSAQETLKGALRRMTQNHKGVLFVCDEHLHLIGALSDGDVRRTLLDETLLVAPVSKAMNIDPIAATTTEKAKELLHRYSAVAVPVVDGQGHVRQILIEDKDGLKILECDTPPGGADEGADGKLNAVAIVPARGGSKRIPRKNLAVAGGRSLLGWAVHAAKTARQVGQVIVSTDDDEIAQAARVLGVEIPWLRPAELSQDNTTTLDVMIHALEWAVQNVKPTPEFGVLLEPTAPLRTPQHVDEALNILAGSDADSVVSVCELSHSFNPEEVLVIDDGVLRPFVAGRTMHTRRLRGEQPPAYILSG